jgi:hypothetical protein
MSACFTWLLMIAAFVFTIVSMIRWFEQVAEAVDHRWWNKIFVLVVMPPAVWLFPSRIAAGRPIPVPLHQPVMGMGAPPKPLETKRPPARPRPGVDPAQIAKLKQKMREQGMLQDES